MREYYDYFMCNRNNRVFYVGMTNYLERRVLEHKEGAAPSFTRKYKCSKLVWYATFTDPYEAIRMEKRIKHWSRRWKIDLVEKDNPHYEDLGEDVYWIDRR